MVRSRFLRHFTLIPLLFYSTFACYKIADSTEDALLAYPMPALTGVLAPLPDAAFEYCGELTGQAYDACVCGIPWQAVGMPSPQCGCGAPESDCFTGGRVLMVFFSVLVGAFAMGMAQPAVTAVGKARAAAYKVFEVIDRVPEIDCKAEGKCPKDGVLSPLVFQASSAFGVKCERHNVAPTDAVKTEPAAEVKVEVVHPGDKHSVTPASVSSSLKSALAGPDDHRQNGGDEESASGLG